jgi:periplasmic protein TonB
MCYLWVAAIGAAIVSGPVAGKPAPKRVPIPKEFPNVLAVPPPPMILTMPPPAPPAPPPPPAP